MPVRAPVTASVRAPVPAGVAAIALALLAAFAAPAGAAGAADPAPPKLDRLAIVDRAIEHHGGDRYAASETALDLCSLSGCFHLVVRVDGGLYDYDVRGEVRGVERRVRASNDRVERWDDGEPAALDPEGERRARDFVDARVYFPFLPYRLNDPGVYKQDLGLERWGERELHKVKVTFERGSSSAAEDEYLYWFDPGSGRLEQFAYSFAGSPGGLRFRRGHGHRRVGGLLFFDQENLGVDEDGLAVDQVTPEFVAARMRKVSDVVLRGIAVRSLGGEADGP
jgi:hypothetical protein